MPVTSASVANGVINCSLSWALQALARSGGGETLNSKALCQQH